MLQRALFIDRDGIVNVDHGYVSQIHDFEFSDGIFDLMRLFRDAGFWLFIITNQSGIGRGYYTKETFHSLTEWMLERLLKEGISIKEVYYCPHTPDEKCYCRKPSTGMIEEALSTYPIDLKNSWMIGDKESDILLAENAGIGNSIYIGEKTLQKATLSFPSVKACSKYFQANQDKIHSKAVKE